MNINGIPIASDNVAERFANFFEEKVTRIVNETIVNQSVYNGRSKMVADPSMFMTRNKVSKCIKDLVLSYARCCSFVD